MRTTANLRSGLVRLLAVAPLLASLAACDSSSEPEPVLTVTIETETPRTAFMPEFSATRTGGVVLVRGLFETTCQPYALTAAATLVRGELVVSVTDSSVVEGCAPGELDVTYDVRVSGAQRAEFVAVKHERAGLAAVTVFDTTL